MNVATSAAKTSEKTLLQKCAFALSGGWFVLAMLWCEFWLRVSSSSAEMPFWTVGVLLTAVLTAAISGLFYGLTALLSHKWRYGVLTALFLLGSLICMVQTVYFNIFDNYCILFSVRALGDTGIGDYKDVTTNGILGVLGYLILEAIPFVLWCVFGWRLTKSVAPSVRKSGVTVALSAVLYAMFVAVIALLPRGDLSPWNLYWSTMEVNPSVSTFGAMNTLRLDAKYLLFGGVVNDVSGDPNDLTDVVDENPASATDARDVVMDVDFAALAAAETDDDVKMLHTYFATVAPSKTNAYTGKFQGKNVIWVTAESFYSFAVDENLTPTLYKMAHSGLEFTNYYVPLWGVSTLDGEYSSLVGLLPKSGVWSMWSARENDLHFTVGNVTKRAGYNTFAYHNGTYDYYDRNQSHENLGYDRWTAVGAGLTLPHNVWPNSDVELIEATTDDYLSSDEPFSVYYLTISGHAPNNFAGSAMAKKHEAEVENLPYSEEVRGYIAANLELENAMTTLLDRLEAAGKLDDTLIILTPDHYPYGLSRASLTEMLGKGYDRNFEVYRNTLMVYNPAFAHTVVDKPCCAADVLPTALNLLGAEYDSRLLMGSDILSDSPGLVVFSNRSWITDSGRYNAVTDTFTANAGVTVSPDYVEQVNAIVSKKFTVSALMLDTDYYRTLFGTTPNQP